MRSQILIKVHGVVEAFGQNRKIAIQAFSYTYERVKGKSILSANRKNTKISEAPPHTPRDNHTFASLGMIYLLGKNNSKNARKFFGQVMKSVNSKISIYSEEEKIVRNKRK